MLIIKITIQETIVSLLFHYHNHFEQIKYGFIGLYSYQQQDK